MPVPAFQPRAISAAGGDLFDRILERIHRDLPRAVGLTVAQFGRQGRDGVTVLASRGLGRDFIEAQVRAGDGPVMAAVEFQVPVLSPDLHHDDRWPALLRDSAQDPVWRQFRGAAAVPGFWHADDTVVLAAALEGPADAATIIALIGYEQLVAAAMVTAAAQDDADLGDMLAVLQSRGSIEQAKGVIMGLLRCDADTAWNTLRQASHESNVKLRVLAVALVEHIGGVPAEQPSLDTPIVADEPARRAARLLWEVLSRVPRPTQ